MTAASVIWHELECGSYSEDLQLWRDLAHRHGCDFTDARFDEILAKDVELNVQGLMVWLKRRNKGLNS